MASTDFAVEQDAFLDYYARSESLLRGAATSFATLIQLLLSDAENFETPSVESRVKDRDECISKFKRKYQADCERKNEPYEIRRFITDLVGVRIICLYENELHAIADVLGQHFEVLGQTDKAQKLEERESEFGYKALHLDLRLNGTRSGLAEYRRFVDLQFEVQIRTAIQDAWSTLDHKIKYKKSIPPQLKRRINRLAALFELADQEFRLIRDETVALEANAKSHVSEASGVISDGHDRTGAQSGDSDGRLNAAEFIAIAATLSPGYPFDPNKADSFVQELLQIAPEMTASELKAKIVKYKASVEEYKRFQLAELQVRMNPYTMLRHVLYLSDPEANRDCLFQRQRTSFDGWLRTRTSGTNENQPL